MTASETAKQAGFRNLAELSEISGQSSQTLNNWYNDKPKLFNVVLLGSVAVKHRDVIHNILEGASKN